MNKYWLISVLSLLVGQQSFAQTSSMDGNNININGRQTVTICGEDRIRLSTNCVDGVQQSLTYDTSGNLSGINVLTATTPVFSSMFTSAATIGSISPFTTDLSIFQPLQLFTSNTANAFFAGSNDPNSDVLYFIKSRATDGSADVVVQNGDTIFNLAGFGSDGSSFRSAGGIQLKVAATAGANDMPSQLEFFTTLDGTTTAAQRFIITTFGDFITGTAGGSVLLTRSGTTLGLTESTPASACMGVSTPNGATPVTVTTTCAVTNARVFFTRVGAAPSTKGALTVTTAPNGSSFQYTGIAGDTEANSVVWMIIRAN